MTGNCTDIERILSETIQLENYIFRKTVTSKKNNMFSVLDDFNRTEQPPSNDLDLGMNILPELAK